LNLKLNLKNMSSIPRERIFLNLKDRDSYIF
jgi:hypothetical protein